LYFIYLGAPGPLHEILLIIKIFFKVEISKRSISKMKTKHFFVYMKVIHADAYMRFPIIYSSGGGEGGT